MTNDDDATEGRSLPACPVCSHRQYRQEKGKIDSAWGMTAHRVEILICENCGYILLFSEGRTLWDFD
ncbi:MAG TPA: hypothetical protein VGJ71_01425 [Candidatus Limnocylindrales bacterium]|jgi:hypothetical protein